MIKTHFLAQISEIRAVTSGGFSVQLLLTILGHLNRFIIDTIVILSFLFFSNLSFEFLQNSFELASLSF